MKGDFTRETFNRGRHYHAVRMQQGRVQLDADWNEQVDIQLHLDETTRRDVIGATGAPKKNAGFGISALGGPDLAISAGRIYVDGTLCEIEAEPVAVTALATDHAEVATLLFDGREIVPGQRIRLSAPEVDGQVVTVSSVVAASRTLNFAPVLTDAQVDTLAEAGPSATRVVTYATQPDYPDAAHLDDAGAIELAEGRYLAYLDVWDRHVTATEDGDLLEPALGGPDTATRQQVVSQVKLLEIPDEATGEGCDLTWPDWESLVAGSTGTMRARARPETEPTEPCELPPRAGYRRLENQLYRVEIHDAGDHGVATFKWSRDNGSVVSRWVGQPTTTELQLESTGKDEILTFAPGEVAELTDDGRDLRGEPGDLVEVVRAEGSILEVAPLQPNVPVDINEFGSGAKVRRWNCTSLEMVDTPATNDGFLALEDGVEVRFESGSYATGDYWLVPARTLESDIEWPQDSQSRPEALPARGIDHAYARLAMIAVDVEGGIDEDIVDCRPPFPALTEICAEDVCFDNGECGIPNAASVQDALDYLCEQHDHRFHNKHLHGWGIVCGLQVHCDDEDRNQVIVRDGYAIDCEGRDIILREDAPIPVMELIEELLGGDENVLTEGDGEVALTVSLDDTMTTSFEIEPFDPDQQGEAEHLFHGTLLMDFYENCIVRLRDFLDEELGEDDEEEGPCIGGGLRRLAAVTNVLFPAVNPRAGHSIFVDRAEHDLVLGFYERLRDLLASETYCAMFDNARPYPDYPLEDVGIRTIYGKGFHARLRARPGGEEVYTVGAGINPAAARTRVNRYDLRTNCLVEEIDPLAGRETADTDTGAGAVEDVAFSPDGSTIYVITQARSSRDTYFRTGTFKRDGTISWGPLATLCGTRLVTLAMTAADPEHVYAVGLTDDEGEAASGLYRIDPTAPEDEPSPIVAFNAVGHLEMRKDGIAAATATTKEEPGDYNQVLVVNAVEGTVLHTIELGTPGRDDIALQEGSLHVTTGSGGNDRITAYDMGTGQVQGDVPVELDDNLRLQPLDAKRLLLTAENHNYARVVSVDGGDLELTTTVVPMQVGPIAVDLTDTGEVAVLNYVSNTIIVADELAFAVGREFPHQELATYKRQALEAFVDLIAGLLQYLKDCLCEHFLVDCPECTGDETLYLGVISIRDGSVYKVCNFSKRRDVKTWPKVSYWASIFPLMPILDKAVEWFCCAVLPDLFGRYQATEVEEVQFDEASNLHLNEFRGAVATSQEFDVRTRAANVGSAQRSSTQLLTRGLAQPDGFARTLRSFGRTVDTPATVADGPPATPSAPLPVAAVNPLEPLAIAIRSLGGAGPRLTRPDAILSRPRTTATDTELRAEVAALSEALDAREVEIAELRAEVENQREVRSEIETLRASIARLENR